MQATASLAEGPVRVRIGVHTGEALLDPPKYVGADVHKAARIMSAAHGGQVVLSAATHELVVGDMLELGRHRLKDFAEPVLLYQLGLERFPPLRTISNTNLPVALSSFVGRGREVREIVSLVRQRRGAARDACRAWRDRKDAAGGRSSRRAGERLRRRSLLDRAGTDSGPGTRLGVDRADARCDPGAGGAYRREDTFFSCSTTWSR